MKRRIILFVLIGLLGLSLAPSLLQGALKLPVPE